MRPRVSRLFPPDLHFHLPSLDSSDSPFGHIGLAHSTAKAVRPRTAAPPTSQEFPCEWLMATCGAARSAQIASAAAQTKANAKTRAKNLVINSPDHSASVSERRRFPRPAQFLGTISSGDLDRSP